MDEIRRKWAGPSTGTGSRGVVRFPVVDGRQIERPAGSRLNAGDLGCLRSQLAVVERFRDEPRLPILEDDCLFVPRFRERFSEYEAQLPRDWHLLRFGDNRRGGRIGSGS